MNEATTKEARAKRAGGRILVDCLERQGADHIFCVPGESYLPVLDALHDSPIALTVCRQEGGAAMMAEAAGKLTGRPGLCFVTRGPGATNASSGVHVAAQDSTPLILFIGQVARAARHREAFQEIDYSQMFGGMAKWVAEIGDPARIPEFVSRAFHVATGGRPGPVVLALPEDILSEEAKAPDIERYAQVETRPGAEEMAALADRLAEARRPFMLLGGSRWDARSRAAIARFAERFQLPVATSFRRQMLFDPYHPSYAGDGGISINPKLHEGICEADLVLLVGGRLGEMASCGYTLLDIPEPRQSLVHVHADAEELGRVYRPSLAIHASPGAFALAADKLPAPPDPPWAGRMRAAHAEFLRWTEKPQPNPGPVQLGEIMVWLRARLPEDAVVANGAGNYAGWLHRYYRYRQWGTQLAPISGSMGYGLPAALAAKRLDPGRTVVAFTGDGCFLMTGQEFATAVQYGLAIITVVIDNGMYGTIRMHQEKTYPGRVSGTGLVNPDFAALARAHGGHGETVERTEDFAPAFERAAASGLPALLHVKVDPDAISTVTSLTALAAAARGGA